MHKGSSALVPTTTLYVSRAVLAFGSAGRSRLSHRNFAARTRRITCLWRNAIETNHLASPCCPGRAGSLTSSSNERSESKDPLQHATPKRSFDSGLRPPLEDDLMEALRPPLGMGPLLAGRSRSRRPKTRVGRNPATKSHDMRTSEPIWVRISCDFVAGGLEKCAQRVF